MAQLSPTAFIPLERGIRASGRSMLFPNPEKHQILPFLTKLEELGPAWVFLPQLGPWSFTSWREDGENPQEISSLETILPKGHACSFSLLTISTF